jgi:hypothetical protein
MDIVDSITPVVAILIAAAMTDVGSIADQLHATVIAMAALALS